MTRAKSRTTVERAPPLTVDDDMEAVVRALQGKRLPLEDEKRTQDEIETALKAALGEARVGREVRVMGGIIDFFCLEAIGVEVKIKGPVAAIGRQLYRYAEDPSIRGLILATNRPFGLASSVRGKPLLVFDLSRAWL